MADGVSMSVNTVQYEAAMQRLRAGVRAGFVDPSFGTLTVQGRLLAQRCADFTPPRDIGQGKAAVARDITRIFRPLDHTTFTDRGLRRIIRADDRAAWNKAALNMRGTHNLGQTQAMGFSPAFHKRNRISRGRGGRAKYGNLGYVTLGPEGRKVRDYIGEVKKRVGWARAGWSAGIIGLGGSPKGAWVARHGSDGGSLVDGRSSDDPFVQVINETRWARYRGAEGRRILANAIQARARDMEAYYIRMMKIAAQRSGALTS